MPKRNCTSKYQRTQEEPPTTEDPDMGEENGDPDEEFIQSKEDLSQPGTSASLSINQHNVTFEANQSRSQTTLVSSDEDDEDLAMAAALSKFQSQIQNQMEEFQQMFKSKKKGKQPLSKTRSITPRPSTSKQAPEPTSPISHKNDNKKRSVAYIGNPPKLNINNDITQFNGWLFQWDSFLDSSAIIEKDPEYKTRATAAAFSQAMTTETINWIMGQKLNKEECRNPDVVLPLIKRHYEQGTSQVVKILDLLETKASHDDTLDSFATKLRRKADEANLHLIQELPEFLLAIVYLQNIDDDDARKQLLFRNPENLQDMVKIAKNYDQASKTSLRLKTKHDAINTVSTYKRSRDESTSPDYRGRKQQRYRSPSPNYQGRSSSPAGSKCFKCDQTHGQGQCPGFGRECFKCHKIGHLAQACKGPQFRHPNWYNRRQQSRGRQQSNDPITSPNTTPIRESKSEKEALNESNNIELPGTEVLSEPEEPDEATLNKVQTAPKPLQHIEIIIFGPDETGVDIKALPDTGANVNVLPLSQCPYLRILPEAKQTGKNNPIAVDGRKIPTYGNITLRVKHKRSEATLEFVIMESRQCILSQESLKKFQLIPEAFPHVQVPKSRSNPQKSAKSPKTIKEYAALYKVNMTSENKSDEAQRKRFPAASTSSIQVPETVSKLIKEFPTVFDENCTPMSGPELDIELVPNAIPTRAACRTVPDPMMPALAAELEKLEAQGIISKTERGTKWLHPIVVVKKKDGGVRLCVDFKKLNQHIYRPVNPQPTPRETVQRIPNGMQYFAVFDALKGYHQISLAEESRELTTFITPFGQYHYNRLPFGLNLAGDVFTRRYGKAIDHVEGTARIVEDSLVYAPDLITLERRTRLFLQAAENSGITLNKSKIQYGRTEVEFGGFVVSKAGYKPNKKLLEALEKFPQPQNRTDMKSFFGLANQLGAFKPDLSRALTPLKELLSTKNAWHWLPHHQEAFEAARIILAQITEMNFYDPNNPLRLSADASRLHGLGFVLKQHVNEQWVPIQAGSRMLTQAETNYAMVELELLAIQWATSKCENFLYGLNHFEITTDHKPLIPILNEKCLNQIENKRLQRLRSKMDHLNFTVQFIKGSLNHDADALSRAPINDATPEESNADEQISSLYQVFEIVQEQDDDNATSWAEIIRASEDQTSAALRNYAENGWPEKNALLSDLWPYWNIKEQIWVDNEDLLVSDAKLIIPKKLRAFVLNRLKALHLGLNKTIQRARSTMWWPGMNGDIKNILKECLPCQQHAPSVPKTIEAHHDPTTRAMQAIHADLCEIEGHHFLISIDQYSGWLWIESMGKSLPNASKLIETFTDQFKVGIPDTLYTDGATMFTSAQFQDFTKAWNIKHRTSSPHYHQSNGIAEEAVKEAKKMIRPNLSGKGVDLQGLAVALLGYHNTPKRNQTLAPSQKVFGRLIKDTLPTTPAHLEKLWEREATQKESAAKKNQDTQPKYRWENFKVGDRVYIQNQTSKEWDMTGTILQQGNNIHEWLVKTDANSIYRRNHHYLRAEEKKAWLAGSAPLDWNKPAGPNKMPENRQPTAQLMPTPRSILKRDIRPPARYVQNAERKTKLRFAPPAKDDQTKHENTRDQQHPFTLRKATAYEVVRSNVKQVLYNPYAERHARIAREGALNAAKDVKNGNPSEREFWYRMRGGRWINERRN